MAEEQRKSGIGGIGDGVRTGIGILSALKDALEETFQEAVDRGDLSPERAKRAMRDAAQKVQTALEDARERVDLAPQRELDDLRSEVARLSERVARLEADHGALPGPGA